MRSPEVSPRVRPASAARLRERLLAWYRDARRDLPWRRTRDPYAIWVSEAMLQQTRVETVLGYWGPFLERFPDFRALAEAPEEDVLAAWSGLGYYRRARGLQRTARAVLELHGGRFPETREELLALPGIGPYTAGAVLSIALGKAAAVVDGNVARVLSRRFGLEGELGTREAEAVLWSLAEELVPRAAAGDWNQALMELGATVCTPRRYRCEACPISAGCAARDQGRVDELPRKAPRRVAVPVELELYFVETAAGLLLEQRPEGGRMAGMWQLPTRELTATGLFPPGFPAARGRRRPPAFRPGAELGEVRHGITHHRILARVRRAELPARSRPGDPYRTFPRPELEGLALTGMTRKVLAASWIAS